MNFTVIIEQTNKYPKRIKYISENNSFIEKDCPSLAFVRNFQQPYGWIKESGTPPEPHLDAIVMTDAEYELGDEVPVRVIGVFVRSDGDHKLVTVHRKRGITDYSELEAVEKEDLLRLYPGIYPGEGWFGRERAVEVIKKTSTILTEPLDMGK